jgi:putative transposase
VATGVNATGFREILGLDLVTSQDGAGWTAFLRELVARGLYGVRLVISDADPGLVDAVSSSLPGQAGSDHPSTWVAAGRSRWSSPPPG